MRGRPRLGQDGGGRGLRPSQGRGQFQITVEPREARIPGMMADRTAPLRQTSSKPHGSSRSSIAERHEVLVVLVVTERREHEGAGAAPDTGRRSLGNAFPWRHLRVVRRPRERVLRRARDKAAAVHWLAAPRRFRDLHALAGGPGVVMAYLPDVRN